MDFQIIQLTNNDFLAEDERQGWEEGVFIGKEKGNFYIDLPNNYEYSQDLRLQGTNSFVIKNQEFNLIIIGEEAQKSFNIHENEQDNFENSIKEYLDKAFTFLKANGIERPQNLKLYKVEVENISWYRAKYSYVMNNKVFSSGYNLLGKALIKIFAGKALNEAGYGKNKVYREHKIIDFISLKIDTIQKYFAIVYSFDEVSTTDIGEMMKTINEISKSLGYYNGK